MEKITIIKSNHNPYKIRATISNNKVRFQTIFWGYTFKWFSAGSNYISIKLPLSLRVGSCIIPIKLQAEELTS